VPTAQQVKQFVQTTDSHKNHNPASRSRILPPLNFQNLGPRAATGWPPQPNPPKPSPICGALNCAGNITAGAGGVVFLVGTGLDASGVLLPVGAGLQFGGGVAMAWVQ